MQKTNKNEFTVEKVIKKGDKLDVEWKCFDNSFYSWFDKWYIVISKSVIFHLVVIVEI